MSRTSLGVSRKRAGRKRECDVAGRTSCCRHLTFIYRGFILPIAPNRAQKIGRPNFTALGSGSQYKNLRQLLSPDGYVIHVARTRAHSPAPHDISKRKDDDSSVLIESGRFIEINRIILAYKAQPSSVACLSRPLCCYMLSFFLHSLKNYLGLQSFLYWISDRNVSPMLSFSCACRFAWLSRGCSKGGLRYLESDL